ncbi:Domain of unknown function (DUF1985 [Striga hermonthica]|uniref:Ubiquitin-like protease family profile domain-containing protein n=1 Tax=Striga hermonthica TaxID=68872 RepID=A0A9N7NBQ6_STRHE|nr:Domain of unknown function (DUF1985 [Striga hermonthica]
MAKVKDENYVSESSSEGKGSLEQNNRKFQVQCRRRLVQKKIQFDKKNQQTKGYGEHSHVRCPITRSSAQKKRFSQKKAMELNEDAKGKKKVKYPEDIDSDFEVEKCIPVDEEESEDGSEANKSAWRRSKGNAHKHKSICSELDDEDLSNKHQREHKDWELIVPSSRALTVKIINSNDNSRSTTPIADIKRLLSNDQLKVFRNSAFGKFIDLPHYKVQNQLVNLISLREVHQPRLDEMWFDFGGKIMRFGVEEFTVISGLKCNGLCKKLCFPPVPDGLFDRYFANVGLNRHSIKWLFLNRAWINDHDGVKLAKLHLLANFLMGAQDNLLFDRRLLDILDSQDCDNYLWGKEVYDYTIDYLKMSSRNEESFLKKLDGAEKRVYLYRIRGFILSLQVWFYEGLNGGQGAKPNDDPRNSRHQENVGIHKEVDVGIDIPDAIEGLEIGIRGNQNLGDLVSVVDIPFEKIKRVKKGRVICKSCPFDTEFWDTMRFDLTSEFFEWFKVGQLKNRRKKNEGFVYYDKKNTTLIPPFDFNVAVVSDKNWFYTLFEYNCFLDGSHMDVLFYYIRKIGLYALEPSQKFTTTDNFFDQQMKSLYSRYIVSSCDPGICTIDSVIVDYIFGFKILCGKSWLHVDYVLFPIHVKLEGVGHWILGRLSFQTRTLMIYNSYRSTDFDQVVLESVKRYSILIPIFLALVKFVPRRADIKTNIGPYSEKAENDPLDVIFVEDLPQQQFCDCGVFVASFAEYIVFNVPINAANFDVDIERLRFSYLLYTHGKMKQEKDSESDDDSPGPMPANYRSLLVLPYTN